ncbi:MAG TPA: hypothetical protein PLE24_01105 [Chitinispirillaceae bacterium]|jgi:hypothetical protein|nr:hypothetical protein [Chitinispirillaceae bacterium]
MRRFYIAVLSFLLLAVSASYARNILEKKMFYLSNTGKTGMAKFWVIYLGNFDCKLNRKFPGEPEQRIDASMNLQYLSSGYIEGNGYSAKGKVDCLPTMWISNENGERMISSDSIDFVYDYGRKVQLLNGENGAFIINVEGDKKESKKFLMREYKMQMYYGEEILKEGSEETPLAAFAYSKEGLARAQKAQAKLDGNQ